MIGKHQLANILWPSLTYPEASIHIKDNFIGPARGPTSAVQNDFHTLTSLKGSNLQIGAKRTVADTNGLSCGSRLADTCVQLSSAHVQLRSAD